MKNFVSANNNVSISSRGCIVTGTDNFVGFACKNISLINCIRCSVVPNASNVVLVGCTGLQINQSNVTYVNNILQSGIKISLNADQIKTLNSIPIDTGIVVNEGEAIEVISSSLLWNSGSIPYFIFTFLSLIIEGASFGYYPPIADYSASAFKNFVFEQSVGVDLIDGGKLMITADMDSPTGSGDCEIFINYRIIKL
jgi:hypothetical protein